MNDQQRLELAEKLKALIQSEHWEVVEVIERELHERFKSEMVANGFKYAGFDANPQGGGGVQMKEKSLETYAKEQIHSRGKMDGLYMLQDFRKKIIQSLKEEKNG